MGSGCDELRRRRQRVYKPGTRPGKVESPGFLRANFRLNQAGARGEEHVGSNSRNDNQIEFIRIEAALLTKPFRGCGTQVARGLAFIRDPAFANARPLENPFIGCVDDFLQIFVADSALRQVMADGSYFCATQAQ